MILPSGGKTAPNKFETTGTGSQGVGAPVGSSNVNLGESPSGSTSSGSEESYSGSVQQIEINDISFASFLSSVDEGQRVDIGGGRGYYTGRYELNLKYKYISDSESCLTLKILEGGNIIIPEHLKIICDKGENVEKKINIGILSDGNYNLGGEVYTGDQIQPIYLMAGKRYSLCDNSRECSNPIILRAA